MSATTSENIKGFVGLAFIGLLAYGCSRLNDGVEEHKAQMASTSDPVEYADLYFHDKPEKNLVRTSRDGNALSVTVNKETAWSPSSLRSEFLWDLNEVVPTMISKFDPQSVTLTFETEFTDMRGNARVDKALSATFTKANANSIVWKNVSVENLPKLADKFYIHPGLARQIANGE